MKLVNLKSAVILLSGLLTTSYAYANEPANNLNATLLLQVQDLQETIKQLRGDIEQLQFESAKQKEQMQSLSADVDFRLSKIEKVSADAETNVALRNIDEKLDVDNNKNADKKAASAIGTDKEKAVQAAYQSAYQLIKNKQYKEAKTAFESFVNSYPQSELVANSYFWLGEIAAKADNHAEAATNYLQGYQKAPTGQRAPDNLYKLASSLKKIDKRKEACISLQRLKKEFPKLNTTMKKQLEEDLKSWSCSE